VRELKPCVECQREYFPLRLGLCQNCYMRRRNRHGYQSTYVDAEPVRQHIQSILDQGFGVHPIAQAAGLRPTALYYILNGKPSAGLPPARRVARKTADAIMSVYGEVRE
jgi:hypothetical protein